MQLGQKRSNTALPSLPLGGRMLLGRSQQFEGALLSADLGTNLSRSNEETRSNIEGRYPPIGPRLQRASQVDGGLTRLAPNARQLGQTLERCQGSDRILRAFVFS